MDVFLINRYINLCLGMSRRVTTRVNPFHREVCVMLGQLEVIQTLLSKERRNNVVVSDKAGPLRVDRNIFDIAEHFKHLYTN